MIAEIDDGASLHLDMTCILLQYTRDRPGGGAFGRRLSEQEAQALASDLAQMLSPRIGGRYVPKRDQRDKRDKAVWKDFKGNNHAEVMAKHGISRRLLFSILSRMRRSKQVQDF